MNPHPIDYHSILAQIALEHPRGGADLQAEVARRFMAGGGVAPMSFDPSVATGAQTPEIIPNYAGSPNLPEDSEISYRGDSGEAAPTNPNVLTTVPDPTPTPITEPLPPNDPDAQPAEGGIPLVPTGDKQATPAKSAPRGTGGGQPAENEDDRKYDAATNDIVGSLEDQADVAKQKAAQAGPEQRDIATQQQAMLDKSNSFNSDLQQTELRLGQKQEDLINQYTNATVKPDRYWSSLDTGHQILAGVSLFLGGGGDANPVIQAINRDVALQKDQIERTGKAAGMVGELIDHYRGMGLDNRQATGLAVTTASEIGKQRAVATATQFAGPEAGAALGQKIAEATQGGIVGKMNLKNVAAQVAEHKAAAYASNVSAQTGAYNLGQAKKYGSFVEQSTGVPGAPPGGIVTDMDGNTGVSLRGDEGAKQYQAEVAPAQKILQSISNIDSQRKAGTVGDKAALKSEAEALKSSVLEMHGLKDNPKAAQMADALVGDPAETFGNPLTGGWEQKRAALVQMANQQMARSAAQNQIVFKKQPGLEGLTRPVLPSIRKKHG